MATGTFAVTVTAAPAGAVSGNFSVTVGPPSGATTGTFTVTVSAPIPYIQRPGTDGVLRRAQLGRVNAAGTGIDWLSPAL